MMDRTLRDPLTGLGNRVALMEELENLGDSCAKRPSPCSTSTASKRSMPASAMPAATMFFSILAQRLAQTVSRIWRRSSASAAMPSPCCCKTPAAKPAETRRRIGRGLRRGASAWRDATSSRRPAWASPKAAKRAIRSICLKNAELALMQAKRQGGDCARVYTPELEALAPARRRGARSRTSPRLDKRRDRSLLSAHRAAGRSYGRGLRGAAALAPSRQGSGRAGRLHRPFRGDRA